MGQLQYCLLDAWLRYDPYLFDYKSPEAMSNKDNSSQLFNYISQDKLEGLTAVINSPYHLAGS
jgi:hypothetical protein